MVGVASESSLFANSHQSDMQAQGDTIRVAGTAMDLDELGLGSEGERVNSAFLQEEVNASLLIVSDLKEKLKREGQARSRWKSSPPMKETACPTWPSFSAGWRRSINKPLTSWND